MNIVRKINKTIVAATLMLLAFCGSAFSQENTMYFMPKNPQRIHINPAYMPDCKMYIEVPLLSGFQYAYNNTAFAYNNLLKPGTGLQTDSLVFNYNELVPKLGNRNYIRNDLRFNIIGGGMYVNDMYLSVNVSNHTETRFGFSRDMLAFAFGNWDLDSNTPRLLDFSGLNLNVTNYTSIGFTLAKPVGNGSFGITARYLIGGVNISAKAPTLELITQADPMSLTANAFAELNASLPATPKYNEYGLITGFDTNFGSPVSDFLFTGNNGFAFDFGLITQMSDGITVSASITDLGLIGWKKTPTNFTADGHFTFEGFNLDTYQTELENTTLVAFVRDSIMKSIEFKNAANSYSTLLSPKLYVGLDAVVSDIASISLTARAIYYDKQIDPAATLALNVQPISAVSVGLSYSVMNRSFMNVGAYLGVGKRYARFYIASDNIPLSFAKVNGALLIPYSARTFNIRTGVNIVLGCNKKDEKRHSKGAGDNRYCPAY